MCIAVCQTQGAAALKYRAEVVNLLFSRNAILHERTIIRPPVAIQAPSLEDILWKIHDIGSFCGQC